MSFKKSALALTIALGAGVVALGSAPRAEAATLTFLNTTVVATGFQFNYRMDLAQNEFIRTGDFFTVYDFGNFVSASGPAGFTATTQFTGLTPGGVLPVDSASILNVSFTYSGPTLGTNAPLQISGFSIVSTVNVLNITDYTAQTGQQQQGGGVTTVSSIGDSRSGGGIGGATAAPEPGAMALLAAGLPILGVAVRRRMGRRA